MSANDKKEHRFGDWDIEYMPEDGARISRLQFKGHDLLTLEPDSFRAPAADYGQYETRPVYGYDDCFPTVDACPFPGRPWEIPDHGELCWYPWDVTEQENGLLFQVDSKELPVTFRRRMTFGSGSITWDFEINNKGDEELPLQHVMHPLMPLSRVSGIKLPGFDSAFDDIKKSALDLSDGPDIADFLLSRAKGTFEMLFLVGTAEGRFSIDFNDGLRLSVIYPHEFFPCIGIWWNNSGYPDEEGIRRDECAFEPTPGHTSSLARVFKQGGYLSVKPQTKLKWRIIWEVEVLITDP